VDFATNDARGGLVTDAAAPAFAFPVTPGQLQMLWYERDHPNAGSAYHITMTHRLTGPVRPDLVAAAFDAVVRRHEALRTVFRTIDGEPRQVVLGRPTAPLRYVDCGSDEVAADLELRDNAERVFRFDTEPLIRALLVRTSPEHHVLSLVAHHLVTDGRSTGLIMAELVTDYAALSAGDRPAERDGLQLADFTLWQAEALSQDELRRQGLFWQRQLAGVPRSIEMPFDRPRSSVRDNVADGHEFTVPADVTARLRSLAREHGVTMYMMLLAVTQIVLGRCGEQELFVVGTNTERRRRPEFDDVVGYFAGRVPIRADLRGQPNLVTLLGRVRQATLDALSNDDVVFDDALTEPKPPWAPGVPAINQVSFQLFHGGFTSTDTTAAGVRFEPIPGTTERIAKEMLVLFVDEDELRCGLMWLTALFDRATVINLCDDFLAVLDAVSRHPNESIWRLPGVDR
jgi:hypothetical protein